MNKDLDITVLPRERAVERTKKAIFSLWEDLPDRQNQGRAFIKRAKKSDAKRRQEKAARKRNRR